jgi:hypothetical protein
MTDTLVLDLKIAIERLARTSTVMNLALKEGVPLRLLDVMVKPVADSSQDVRRLIAQAIDDGIDLDALQVQIDQPVRDSLADLLADAVSGQVPDDLGGLDDHR